MKGIVDSGAYFSPDRVYRYALWRDWEAWFNMRRLVVIGLNPSTADEKADDPTIRRCIAFAKREGCGGLVMLNLFAFRATDPRAMKAAADPIGPENNATLAKWCRAPGDAVVVVAAWGTHGVYRNRGRAVHRALPNLLCFGLTQDGHPRHPLYLSADTPLVPFPLSAEGPDRG